MASTLVSPLYVLYEQAFGFSDVTLTLVYAVYVLGNLAALLFFGRLSDQIGRRRSALAAIAITALSTTLFLLAEGTAWLFWARALGGFAVGVASGAGTAWIAELLPGRDKARATLIAVVANFIGLAAGALLGGMLSQYAPWPLQLSFVVYLALLVPLAALVARTPETVAKRVPLRRVELRPRFGVPQATRAKFIAPSVAAFSAFALGGFYIALAPTVLKEQLHISNHAVGGALLAELGLVSALAMIATRKVRPDRAMLSALALLLPSLALLVAAQAWASLHLLLLDSALTGLSLALGYRGSLQVVNQIAPPERRGEAVSSYFVACFLGNALPVIGVGLLARTWGLVGAATVFAVLIGILALAAFAAGLKFRPA